MRSAAARKINAAMTGSMRLEWSSSHSMTANHGAFPLDPKANSLPAAGHPLQGGLGADREQDHQPLEHLDQLLRDTLVDHQAAVGQGAKEESGERDPDRMIAP